MVTDLLAIVLANATTVESHTLYMLEKTSKCIKDTVNDHILWKHPKSRRKDASIDDEAEHGCRLWRPARQSRDHLEVAAYGGQRGGAAIVKWLHENRKEGCTTNAMDRAAGNGCRLWRPARRSRDRKVASRESQGGMHDIRHGRQVDSDELSTTVIEI